MILTKVLSLNDDVRRGTDHYIDDIVVNESVVSAERVCYHLRRFDLKPKEPVCLEGGRNLNISLRKAGDEQLWMARGSDVKDSQLTKREVFLLCGRLFGHYPHCWVVETPL